MRRSRLLILLLFICVLAAGTAWLIGDANRPSTAEEEVCSAVLDLVIEGIRSTDAHVLIEFQGVASISDPAVRKRIIHGASPGHLVLIDIYPKSLEGSFQDSITGVHASELLIKIEEWRSPTEVVISVLTTSAPLIGGGGKFLMVKTGRTWAMKEVFETVRI